MPLSRSQQRQAEQLAEWLRGSEHPVWFTGAGISTESGLPDFRGPDGVWTRRDKGLPPPRWQVPPDGPHPNRTHKALVELERQGKVAFLISQNVDGLHLASGFPLEKLAELHGNGELMRCLDCGHKMTYPEAGWDKRRFGPGYLTSQPVAGQPDCPDCGGRLVSTVVNFGDSLPEEDLAAADRHSRECDLFVVLGSSLKVTPAADLPVIARRSGARLVICNLGETPLDEACELRISANVGDVMERVVAEMAG